MRFFYRLGYYLAGFSIGIFFLIFVFSGKKTSCNYGPSSRLKSNLLQKKIQIDANIKNQYPNINDSILKSYIINGRVNFSKSETKLDSCKVYHIDLINNNTAYLKIQNCERHADIIFLKIP